MRKAEHQVGFYLAAYDQTRPLIIDPVLSYATYLGSSGRDDGSGIAVDTEGHAYVTGSTTSPDFPTMHPVQPTLGGSEDAFIAKFAADGSALVYATYLGGSGDDFSNGIAVDANGHAYVTGFTRSPDFPTAHALQSVFGGGIEDTFVAKLTADGSALVYATYLGGRSQDIGSGIAVDAKGHAYVTGSTLSPDFPTMHALQPMLSGTGDAFVAKLTADGSALVYATYLGGRGGDQGLGIAVDRAGAAYVTGTTSSPDFPTMHPLQPTLSGTGDAFVAKLTADGTTLIYATYLGGTDGSRAIAVDAKGHAYVTGFTTSPDFPTTHDALQPTYGGDLDAFVAKLATPLVECIEDCVGEFRDCVDSCQVGDRPGIRACTARFRACIDGCLP